jgi:hypothetical protein
MKHTLRMGMKPLDKKHKPSKSIKLLATLAMLNTIALV